MNFSEPDLTQHPPRSARVKLGGYVIFPRVIDKARAALSGKLGEYSYGFPLDMYFFRFVGVEPEDLKKRVAEGGSDFDFLEWVEMNSPHAPSEMEKRTWTEWMENRPPGDLDYRSRFNRIHEDLAPKRKDIYTTFDLLDLDDFALFGGCP